MVKLEHKYFKSKSNFLNDLPLLFADTNVSVATFYLPYIDRPVDSLS